MRHDDEFTFPNNRFAVAEFHPKHAFDHQKQFILVVMVMPDEFAFELRRLHVKIVELPDDFGAPAVGETAELLRKIDRVHDALLEALNEIRDVGKNAPRSEEHTS